MDSLTQAVVGSLCGELIFRKKIFGLKGLAIGAFWGTLPDLDILFNPFFTSYQQINWHRGPSHSLLFCFLCPVFFHICFKVNFFKIKPTARESLLFGFLVWFTHISIDCFNAYGTQIFEPFSTYRVSIDWLFIIDPLFTGPLILAIFLVILFRKHHKLRLRILSSTCALSLLYLSFAIYCHNLGQSQFQKDLHISGIQDIIETRSLPTPFNCIFRRNIARTPTGYYFSYSHVFKPAQSSKILFLESNHNLFDQEIQDSPAYQAVQHFSEGFYRPYFDGDKLMISDLRFFDFWLGMPGREKLLNEQGWNYELKDSGYSVRLIRDPLEDKDKLLNELMDKIFN